MTRRGCDGQAIKDAVLAAAAYLESQSAAVNALNVFPVPDGDTGTNMSMTMRATVSAVASSPEHDVGTICGAMAYGALMGARGNSGVILSQIIRGFAKAVEGTATLDAQGLAAALEGATKTAYAGVGKPVEGTILTVIRRAAEGAREAADAGKDLDGVLEAASITARQAVAETPTQLAVLRDAGVVDAGGQGLYLLIEGALKQTRGEAMPVEMTPIAAASPATFEGEDTFGYCTQFLIQGKSLDLEVIRAALEPMGNSIIVVGEPSLARIHFHTFDPGKALTYGTSLGILRSVSVENMSVQHDVWAHDRSADAEPVEGITIVTVAAGEGFVSLFESLGVGAIVPGGQTMNPSTQDLLAAIDATPTTEVILLPNNSNVIMAARQASELSNKKVAVIPTDSMVQGVAAVLGKPFEGDFDENVGAMTDAAKRVDAAEITVAVRDATFEGFTIASGQAIGLVNGRMAAVGDDADEVIASVLTKMHADSAEVLTIYWGEGSDEAAAEGLAETIRARYANVQVDVVAGGQPFYSYLIARE